MLFLSHSACVLDPRILVYQREEPAGSIPPKIIFKIFQNFLKEYFFFVF